MLTWASQHHAFVALPRLDVILAGLTIVVAKGESAEAPSFLALCGIWAIGILSHIFLDLVTTFVR